MDSERDWRSLPAATVLLAAVNLLIFIVLELFGSTEDSYFMFTHGALYAPSVLEEGEYFRLISAMFLHFGAAHLMNNLLMLVVIGQRLERAAGKIRFVLIYMLSGAGANLFTVWFYQFIGIEAISAGASGAILGITGGLFAWIVKSHGKIEGIGKRQMLILTGLTVYSGFVSSSTNNAAHISGLLFGFLLGCVLYHRNPMEGVRQNLYES